MLRTSSILASAVAVCLIGPACSDQVPDEDNEDGFVIEPGGASRLKRRIIERALTRCENESPDEIEPLLTLLRRFAAEAAREEARLFCDELVAAGRIEVDPEWHPVAA